MKFTHWTGREPWLPTSAVALLCGVTAQTVLAWAKAGKLHPRKTPGGHYRFNPAEVDALLNETTAEPDVKVAV
ncbi:helix-turn-helix domain-containing protein [Nonomuraea sp. GTA35]|uniref:helix-turn-helix domain-containing protein n=1 Tax=Nonomuraea sp. GTA35 TaxID=1676746 RepID=UPI0035BFE191